MPKCLISTGESGTVFKIKVLRLSGTHVRFIAYAERLSL